MKLDDCRLLFLSASSISSCFKILGFLCSIEDILPDSLDTYCGVGLSSIIILLLAVDYDIRDIIQFFFELSICKSYKRPDYKLDIFSKDLCSSFHREIYMKISDIILKKFGIIPTIGTFFIKTGISIIFPTYNHTTKQIEFIDYRDNSDVSILECLLMAIYNPYHREIYMYENNHYSSCTVADRYPIEYFSNRKSECIGIFCEVDTMSHYMFYQKVLVYPEMNHYLLTRFESTLSDKDIGKILCDGYDSEGIVSVDVKEKKYKFPSVNFRKY